MLTMFGFVGKSLGAVFKIGLTAIVGSYGMGLYQLLFPVLVFFIVFSSEGFSTALTVRQAEQPNKGRGYFILSILSVAVSSLLSFIMILVISEYFSLLQGVEIDKKLYIVVGVGVVIVSLLSVYKARIRGAELFVAYSLFETLEDVLKVVFALFLAWILKPLGMSASVAGIFLGILLSSFITLVIICFYRPKKIVLGKLRLTRDEKSKFFKYSMLSMAAVVVIPAIQFIESGIIISLLTNANITSVVATKLYGISRGSVSAIINLPFFLISSIEVLLLPNLSRSKERGIYYKKTQFCLFFAIALSTPFVLGFFMFSNEFVDLLYGVSLSSSELLVASNLLKMGSLGIVFASLSSFLMVILNSNSKTFAPLVANIIGGVAKILFVIFMTPKISIYAVELASVLFSMIVCLINLIFALRYKIIKKPKFVVLVVLFWAGVFMLIKSIYLFFQTHIESNIIALLSAGAIVGVVVFCFMGMIWLLIKKKVIRTAVKG